VTVFSGCGFAAKYLEGGGNFSVPLQWMLGLRHLRQDAIWLELLPATKNPLEDRPRSTISSGNYGHTGAAARSSLETIVPLGAPWWAAARRTQIGLGTIERSRLTCEYVPLCLPLLQGTHGTPDTALCPCVVKSGA
jgi:hypothetical protein